MISAAQPVTAAAPLNLGTPIAPGIYIETWNQNSSVPQRVSTNDNVTDFTWTSLPQFFVLGNQVYKAVTQGSDSYNDTGAIYWYWVRLISDPDGSLNSSSPRFSGDEVAVWTWFMFQNGTYQETSNYRYNFWWQLNLTTGKWTQMDSASLTTLRASTNSSYITSTNLNTERYCYNALQYMTNQTAPQEAKPTKYAYFSYFIDQAFLPRIERNPTGYDLTKFVAKDRFLTFVAYNDTNHNNIIDFNVTQVPASAKTGAERLALSSSEAYYVFRAISAGAIQYTNPTVTTAPDGTPEVSWGFSITGLLGNMTSTQPQNRASFETKITSVAFNFHFTRNSTEALTKVDEIIGQFNTPGTTTVDPQLNGLSLAILYYSFFEGLEVNKYPTTESNQNGQTVDNEGNSTPVNEVDFNSGGSKLVSIKIGGDTYLWNGTTTENAYSNTLPWFSYQTYFSELGNQSVVNVEYGRDKSVYAACFPEWSGLNVTHDPYFAVLPSSGQPEGTGISTGLVLGIAIVGIIAVAAVVMVRKRKSK
jgi:hypothetical protein